MGMFLIQALVNEAELGSKVRTERAVTSGWLHPPGQTSGITRD